jgi:hypothetical protein
VKAVATEPLSNRLFNAWIWGTFAAYIGMLALVVIACAVYVRAGNIVAALMSDEMRFAARLSVLTATVSTFLSLLFGIPSAYALAYYRGRFKTLVDTFLDMALVLHCWCCFPSSRHQTTRWTDGYSSWAHPSCLKCLPSSSLSSPSSPFTPCGCSRQRLKAQIADCLPSPAL